MVSSKAATPQAYLAELPDDRRTLIAHVRDLVNSNLPTGYVEGMNWGMIAWQIPLARYPDTYNKQPLMYVALAAQKNHNALYLSGVYGDGRVAERLGEAYAAAGRKLDMGKGCLRFRRAEDLLEPALAEAIASVPVERYIARYEATRKR